MGLLRGFMLKTVVTTLTLALALTACSVGSVNGGDDVLTDGSGNDPRAGTFDGMVLPLVTAKTCTDANCHGGTQTPKLSSFAQMTENSALAAKYLELPVTENVIINKDLLPGGTPGMHQGRLYLSQTDKDAISSWLMTGP